MGNLTIALVFVLTLNVLMFMTQVAIYDLNPEAPHFWTNKGTMLENFDKTQGSGEPVLDSDLITEDLPAGEGSVSPTTGNLFTDTFTSIKRWIGQKTGLSYIKGIVTAPYDLLKLMNLPNGFIFAMGTLWYGVTFFLVVAFLWGRE